ncbi:MAG: abortive infection family protein [Planctomycetaceae bacterium]|nr:abortive infection family protein [Planctomycetaceae bacterium]
MSRELISKKTRNEFREYLVGWTLATIANEFDAADISCDLAYDPPVSGQRRSLVEQYYHSLDLTKPDDARKLLNAFENVLISIGNTANFYYSEEQRNQDLARLTACLRRDGYVFENARVVPIAGAVSLDGVRARAVELDAGHLAQQIKRIEQSVDSDPAHAIGSAKELIETCCRTILAERGNPCTEKLDVLPLVRRTLEELSLVPEGIPDEAKGAKSIKAILGNLATISQNLAELRNLYGTGHGKEGRTKGLSPRHARLAVGAATTLALFLFDTHMERLTEPVGASA